MTTRSSRFRTLYKPILLTLLVGGILGTFDLSATRADEVTAISRVTRAVGDFDAHISRASSQYHSALSEARKKFDAAKRGADAAYDKATEHANQEVTLKINTVKEEVAQSPRFDAHVKDKIKGAARDFAIAIARARAVRQGAMADALRKYTEALKKVTAEYAEAVQKAEASYRTAAKGWIQ